MNDAPIVSGQPEALAARIKTARKIRRLNIRELGERSGLSIGAISDIENGSTNATIATISKLCEGLDLSVADLFQEGRLQIAPNTAADRKVLRAAGGIEKSILINNTERGLTQYEVRIEPSGATGSGNIHKGADEYLYVLKNQIVLLLGDSEITLGRNDIFEYSSEIEHQIINRTKEVSIFHWTVAKGVDRGKHKRKTS